MREKIVISVIKRNGESYEPFGLIFFNPLISASIFFSSRAYRDWETDRKSTRLNSSHSAKSRMPSSA